MPWAWRAARRNPDNKRRRWKLDMCNAVHGCTCTAEAAANLANRACVIELYRGGASSRALGVSIRPLGSAQHPTIDVTRNSNIYFFLSRECPRQTKKKLFLLKHLINHTRSHGKSSPAKFTPQSGAFRHETKNTQTPDA